MCKCNQENCNLEVFENADKCILHCEKDDWYEVDDNGNKNWNKSEGNINLFWKKFYEEYNSRQILFGIKNVVFPKFESQGGLAKGSPRKIIFEYLDSYLIFEDCIFEDKISLYKYSHELKFMNCEFRDKFEIVIRKKGITTFIHCNFQYLEFRSVDIEDTIKFEDCIIGEFILRNVDFEFIFSFIKTTINKKIELDHVEFSEEAFFNESTIKDKLDLTKTIFYKQKNFYKLKTEVANRETARIIKDSFEQQNNIIEANKFYALEMKEREKELDPKKDFFEWLVFKFHGLSSNHSQDWTLVLFWIMNINFLYSYLNTVSATLTLVFKILFSLVLILVIGCMIVKIPEDDEKNRWLTTIPITIVCYFFYGYLVEKDWLLSEYSKNLNPFSIMDGNDPINIGTLIYKITIAYLIYQLIISIRQNTRRK
jgi:hypothetical protein